MTSKLTLAQIQQLYQEFCDNFDPSPYYAGDGYSSLPDFDTWFEMDEGGFGDIIERDGLNPADYRYLPS